MSYGHDVGIRQRLLDSQEFPLLAWCAYRPCEDCAHGRFSVPAVLLRLPVEVVVLALQGCLPRAGVAWVCLLALKQDNPVVLYWVVACLPE